VEATGERSGRMDLRLPYTGFDIETYSPNGFPAEGQDPVITATLTTSFSQDLRSGLLLVSLIFPPSQEDLLLIWLHRFLASFRDGCLVTYNGAKFDLGYVAHRGRMHGVAFDQVFLNYDHLDLYDMVRRLRIRPPSYGQKAVEKWLGIDRMVNAVSGASYHRAFLGFLKTGSLEPLFYNIEDSVGCLRILDRLYAADAKFCAGNLLNGAK